MITMPSHANPPHEWQVGSDNGQLLIVMPSRSQIDKTGRLVMMDKETRQLKCECEGFRYRGDCWHVRALVWVVAGPRKRKKGVQPTSLEAFMSIRDELGPKQQIVLKALEIVGHASNKELVTLVGWPINCITPRILELREMGLVEYDSERIDPLTGRSEMVWRPCG